jgi:4-diphosphocytidyl-2-C-methyl-D-erythritol kinase
MTSIATLSYAKINLGLEVLHKRTDGFHAINTIFLRVSLGDALLAAAKHGATNEETNEESVIVECTPALDVPSTENLAYKAAKLLQNWFVEQNPHSTTADYPMHLALQKRIPTGGGLGGGSANAASALRACADLWTNSALWDADSLPARPDSATLERLAALLGSDVPFFMLNESAAIGTGRGEVLQPLSARLPYWILLVCSGIHVSTPWAYRALGRSSDPETHQPSAYAAAFRDSSAQVVSAQAAEYFPRVFVNDFEPPVFAAYPLLERIKSRLYDSGAFFALMSGSGSTMFGLFTSQDAAEQAQQAFGEYQTFICRNV